MAGIVSFAWTEKKSCGNEDIINFHDVTINFNKVRCLTIENVSNGCVDDFRVLVKNVVNNLGGSNILISPRFDTYAEAHKHYLEIVKLFHGTENSVVLYNYDTNKIEYLD